MEYICRRMLPSEYDDGVMELLKETDGEFFPAPLHENVDNAERPNSRRNQGTFS